MYILLVAYVQILRSTDLVKGASEFHSPTRRMQSIWISAILSVQAGGNIISFHTEKWQSLCSTFSDWPWKKKNLAKQ